MEFEPIKWIADLVEAPEPAVRLLISLFIAYPVGFFYRKHLYGKSPNLQHLYFTACGMGICYFNYGTDVIHSIVSILITYLILKILGGSLQSLIIIFVYNMAHMLIGYWATETPTYDIKWTMPHCVLTLRLIALGFNMYDGQQPQGSLSEENKEVALYTMPSLLEIFAHGYFPGTFMVGPLVSMRRYQDFIGHKLEKKRNPHELPDSVDAGIRRLTIGLVYLTIHQVGMHFIYDDYFTTYEYKELPMWKQLFFLGLWSRFTLYKYISCWLITEGSCIIVGLTYNGLDENNKPKWDGCTNVNIRVFELCTRMNHYIESFNLNTNQWVAQYVYKRLKFLNNKMLSHLGALFFLAVWHGFHSGYYATFFFEFISITAEKDVVAILRTQQKFMEIVSMPIVHLIISVFLRIYTFIVMGYAMAPFILLTYSRYMPVFKELYFFLHIICIAIVALAPMVKKRVGAGADGRDSDPGASRSRHQVKMKGN